MHWQLHHKMLVLASSHDLPRSEVQHLSGPQLAAYLRFQAEVHRQYSDHLPVYCMLS